MSSSGEHHETAHHRHHHHDNCPPAGRCRSQLSLATVATQAAAVPVALINGAGQLTGARGVVVGAVTYDVTFVDGSCNSLFGGCLNANFDFHTVADAIAASQALFNQVVSGFGNNPDKIFSCGFINGCQIETPGATVVDPAGLVVQTGRILMFPGNFSVGPGGLPAAFDTSGNPFNVYADWTVATVVNGVPEPGSLALLGLGMAALVWSRRKAARTETAMNSGTSNA